MGYREHLPPRRWRGLVECGWTSAATGAPFVQDVLPDGCMDLVWTGSELLVAGPDTAPHPFRREAGAVAVGLRFAPGVLPALLGVPASTVRDERVPLDALRPEPAREFGARLADCGGVAGEQDPGGAGRVGPAAWRAGVGRDSGAGRPPRAGALDLLAELAAGLPGSPPEPGVRAVAARLAAGASVTSTADSLGWTTRSLHRRCLAAFGYGPTVLRRVLRFRRASVLLAAGVPIADVAARTGYADQPHLSREVRALAGVSPAAMAAAGR